MGRHSAAYLAAQRAQSGAAKYVGRVGALAFAIGVGAAIAGGTAITYAEGPTGPEGAGSGPSGAVASAGAKPSDGLGNDGSDRQQVAPTGSDISVARQISALVIDGTAGSMNSSLRSQPQSQAVVVVSPTTGTVGQQRLNAAPPRTTESEGSTQTVPSPGDVVQTPYGSIGKWMLQSDGQISNYGGQPYAGKTLLEPVNVIILDPKSTTSAESTAKLNRAMSESGFPAQPIHSTGFKGIVNGTTYGQQPSGPLLGYSDDIFVLPNNHGRLFGPAPVAATDGTGYVWTGAFSRETLSVFNFLPTHSYLSSNAARYALALRLLASGQATLVGMVRLDNAVNDATTTTGDHDGYAIVLQLN